MWWVAAVAACDVVEPIEPDPPYVDAGTPEADAGPPERERVDCTDVVEATDDASALLAARPLRDGPLRTLIVLPATGFLYSDVRSLQTHLKGFGVQGDWISDTHFAEVDLAQYSSILLVGSAWVGLELGDEGLARIDAAIAGGADALWLGPGLPPALAPRFGVRVAGEASTGASMLRFTGTGGREVETPTFDEFITRLELDGARAIATLDALPAVTDHTSEGSGRAVCVPWGLAHYWEETLAPDAWARAELLHDVLALVLSRGAAFLGPYPGGHASAFLVRFEDISPGGARYNQHDDVWIERFRRVVGALGELGIRANLALVARYADPWLGEAFDWRSPGEGRARLREALGWALEEHDAELLSHGLTHQYGEGEDDYTGVDWEFSDDASGEWRFLPADEQRARVMEARETLIAEFGRAPRVWETPHLEGNTDTYAAAVEAGFDYINEGDGHLFPNRWGFQGAVNDVALNVPHTGSYVPLDEAEALDYLASAAHSMMPRLVRIGAPFFLFYHGFVASQEEVLLDLARCAAEADLWMPTVSELADWWVERGAAHVAAHVEGETMHVTLTDHPANSTLILRLPDGFDASSVSVNRYETPWSVHRQGGVAYAQVVVPTSADVAIAVRLVRGPD